MVGRAREGWLLLDPRTLADADVAAVVEAVRSARVRCALPARPPPLTLGTAGHIDHGKTALVRALTGKDTDRLPEERERGISIELGYAPLDLPGGRRLSVVDVPGHERFVRTMVAGATGIDLFLLCVAADDGVMPQTREHVAVLASSAWPAGWWRSRRRTSATRDARPPEAAELFPGAEVVAGLGAVALAASTSCWRRSRAPRWARLPGRADRTARRCCTWTARSRSGVSARW